MMNALRLAQANPHIAWPVVVFTVSEAASGIAAIWIPSHKDEISATAHLLKAFAVTWGAFLGYPVQPPTEPPKP